ncbi:MAG: AMP-binding protein [SAR92 clade bacterium]|nr:AMP-binding protein [SAR92 clade bacterium]
MVNNTADSPCNSKTIPQLINAAAAHFDDRVFIDDNGYTITFRQLQEQSRNVAAALMSRDFKLGDKAAIWAPNIYQWVIAAMGIQTAGGVLVTINTRYKGSEAADILRRASASILFSVGDFLDTDYTQMLANEDIGSINDIVVFNSTANDSLSWNDFYGRGEQHLTKYGSDALEQRIAEIQPTDLSDILFTSGTTGAPKGVMTSHEQNIRTFKVWTELLGLNENDRYLIINPFFHSFGYKAGILAGLMRGTTLLPHQVFDPELILERIEREKITMMPGPPTLFQSILSSENLDKFDISSLSKATTGAAVIPIELITKMRKELGINTVLTAYGLTESCGLVSMCRHEDSDAIVATTSGRAIPDIELRCVNEKGQPLEVGQAGEIVVRGFNIMLGYFENSAATAESIDSDGWLHTGDIGYLDAEGNLSITDRLKDMFITGGFNCYPAEIENQLSQHPSIASCAVIGIPDERLGEVAMAWVVLERNCALIEQELISWSRERIANYKVPRQVKIIDSLPLNASGKVLKMQLRSLVTDQKH